MNRAHSDAEGVSVPTVDVPKTVADILTAAADLIEPAGRWTRKVFARSAPDAEDHLCGYDPDAACWCALGAVEAVLGKKRVWTPIGNAAERALEEVVGGHVPSWNDAPERTQAEVVAALREAAAKATGASA